MIEYRKQKIHLIFLFIFFLFFLFFLQDLSYSDNKKNILIFNSYQHGYSWSDQEISGILSYFKNASDDFQLQFEYLDCKFFPKLEHFDHIKELYKFKYSNKIIDLVIVTDNPALDFALKYRSELFPATPIVFCGINGFTKKTLQGQTNISGVAEILDEYGTIDIALKLLPDTKEIVVVVDNTSTGKATIEELNNIIPQFTDRTKFRILPNLPISEVQKEISNLNNDQIVLVLSYSVDHDGRVFDHPQIGNILSKACNRPIFVVHSARLGHGVVGGSLMDGDLHGKRAAEIGMRILKGESADSIPVDMKSTSQMMFDYDVMKKFNIPIDKLPEQSIMINSPESFYEKYKYYVWTAIISFGLLALIIYILMMNILRRKKAENEIKEAIQFKKEVISSAGEGIIVIDDNYQVLIWNNFMKELTGIDTEKAVGKNISDVYPNYTKDGIADLLRKALEGKVSKSPDIYFNIPSFGKINWISVTFSPHRDASGKTLGVIGIISRITERKKAEELLSQEKERLAITLRSIGDGVITTDVNGRITLMNRVAEKLTGWNYEEVIGIFSEKVFQIYDESTRAKIDNPVFSTLKARKITDLLKHTILISKDGTEKIIADSCAPIYDKESNIIGVVIVFRDITETEKIEKELQKAQKLESIGILAGGIAHDFNNILTGILGNISLARMHLKSDDKAYQRLNEAEKASLRAKDLTQQLLTFSKGGLPVKKPCKINGILVDASNLGLRGSNVKIEFDLPDTLFITEIDQGQISQVINNVIINAVQSMPEGGLIRLKAENVSIPSDRNKTINPGKYIKISISDKGVGISREYLNKIFDPFFTTKQKGSGLGLSISFSIIQKHNGYIFVESELGKGTTFNIYLPASDSKNILNESKESNIVFGEGKILVMDDEEVIRTVAKDILSSLGYSVEFSLDGNETIDKFVKAKEQSKPYDLVILDLTIPGGMGGKETIKHILNLDPDVKAIVSSGYSNDPIMSNYNEYGFKGVIIKPYNINEVSEEIHKVLNSSKN